MKTIVYAKIPGTDLADCLFVWAHAVVFARNNNLPLYIDGWGKHRKFFKKGKQPMPFLYRIRLLFLRKTYNPIIDRNYDTRHNQFVFTAARGQIDLFKYLRSHTDLIRNELFQLLTPDTKERLRDIEPPEIGIHYGCSGAGGGKRKPSAQFFTFIIKSLRNARGADFPVTVVTNYGMNEISEILELSNVKIAPYGEGISGLLELSQSHFLILSPDNTFGYWAAFLSNAVVYMDAGDGQEKIKEKSTVYREAKIDISRVK